VNQDWKIGSVQDVIKLGKDHPDKVIIFWTDEHTMAYRYQHNNKEFFDIEVGLYRAETTDEIQEKMKGVTGPYGALTGARVVKFKEG
jgi:hypothetical protein